MAAGKQKNTSVIVMKKKCHIISPPPTEKHVVTPPPPELPSGTVENEMPAHQAKKNKKWGCKREAAKILRPAIFSDLTESQLHHQQSL